MSNARKDSQASMAALQAENALLRTIVETLPFYIFAKDTQSRFLFANKAHRTIMNAPSMEDVLGKTDRDFLPAELCDKYREDELQVMQTGKVLEIDEPSQIVDGEPQWHRTIKIPIYRDGVCEGLVGMAMNITALKRTEEQIKEQTAIIEQQRDTLHELSTPIIPIMKGVIIVPLIGSIDSDRARDMTRSLLAGISHHRAQIVILDITGMPIVDTGVANHLNKTIQAARLKGTRAIITGISDAVAETIVDLGINWDKVETAHDLQSGLRLALAQIGYRISNAADAS